MRCKNEGDLVHFSLSFVLDFSLLMGKCQNQPQSFFSFGTFLECDSCKAACDLLAMLCGVSDGRVDEDLCSGFSL